MDYDNDRGDSFHRDERYLQNVRDHQSGHSNPTRFLALQLFRGPKSPLSIFVVVFDVSSHGKVIFFFVPSFSRCHFLSVKKQKGPWEWRGLVFMGLPISS